MKESIDSCSMRWDASQYDKQHSFVSKLGAGIMEFLDPQPGERILDVGCGTGHLTNTIAERGATAVGLDSSHEMIDVARRNYPTVEFICGDIREFRSSDSFDALFSNAVLHWVQPPQSAVARMSEVLRPGGRLVVEFGGYGNVAQICSALEATVQQLTGTTVSAVNYFPRISEYTRLLEEYGFEVTLARLFDRPTQLEGGECGLEGWLQMFRRPIIDALKPAERVQVISQTQNILRSKLFRDGAWYADYRRLQIVARRLEQSPGDGRLA